MFSTLIDATLFLNTWFCLPGVFFYLQFFHPSH